MSKIRILAIPPDNHGVGKYRIISPYTYLQEHYPDDFHVDIKIDVPDDDKEFEEYDIIALHTFIHNKSTPEFPYNRINSDFNLFNDQRSDIGHNIELDENGLQKFVVTTRPNPCYRPGFINHEEAERLTDFVYVGNAQFEDFMRFGEYGLIRFPKIADELICVDVDFPDCKISPGIIQGEWQGKKYEGKIDLVRFQDVVCKRFYNLMKQSAIERAAISLDEGGLTAEQIKEILGLIEPLL